MPIDNSIEQYNKQYNCIMSTRRVKLPSITKKTQQMSGIPNDEDLILNHDSPSSSTATKRKLKIWEKKTASCRTKLQRFDKFDKDAIDDKYVPLTSYNKKDKKIIQNALDIVNMRKKNKDLQEKSQAIVDILEQKKQMFLVTMTHGIIQNEINNLKNQADDRQKALKESNDVLQQDAEDFEQHQQKYKNQIKKIEDQVEKRQQNRLQKEHTIKSKQIHVNSLRADKSKNQQTIFVFQKYKDFLDKLPPQHWTDKKNEPIKAVRRKLQEEWKAKHKGIKQLEDFEKYFQEICQSGQNDQIENILSNEEMYFKEPHELIDYFNSLEEKNLFSIQNAQYVQQKYQELKLESEHKKKTLKEKYQNHKEQKKQLQKQLLQLDNQIKQLKKKKQINNSTLDEKNSQDIKVLIEHEYVAFKDSMHHYLPEIQYNAEALSFLSCIEICMQKLWQKLGECYSQNPKVIKDIKTMLQKKKTTQKREQANRNNKIEDEKRKIRNMQKKQPTLKMLGRLDMTRSRPLQKAVTKKVQNTNKDQDDDRKYLE